MRPIPLLAAVLMLAAAASGVWLLWPSGETATAPSTATAAGEAEPRPVPVELALVERGALARRRTLTGTLEPQAEQVIAPKIAGRIDEIGVDLADRVERGQVVVRLDNDEYLQAVAQAEADLAVAEANLAEAQSLLAIAERELTRIDQLSDRGVSSESQRDIAKADQLAKQALVAVTGAQVTRARAALAAARIRLGYTEVAADWRGGNDARVVAERFVEEGETVAANEELFRIIELDPITAVIHVTERDYALLSDGQAAELRTDAFPGRVFEARVARIAPVFRETTRQARVELTVDNRDLRLKPGMFVRASVVLDQAADAIVVPEPALTTRDGREGLFVLAPDGARVDWRPVQVGIRDGQRAQVLDGGELAGQRVVTLGQQLLDDGSAVLLPADDVGIAETDEPGEQAQAGRGPR
jgi:RND family efflux transporter MFP subunit